MMLAPWIVPKIPQSPSAIVTSAQQSRKMKRMEPKEFQHGGAHLPAIRHTGHTSTNITSDEITLTSQRSPSVGGSEIRELQRFPAYLRSYVL
jgi:hypothetical protein